MKIISKTYIMDGLGIRKASNDDDNIESHIIYMYVFSIQINHMTHLLDDNLLNYQDHVLSCRYFIIQFLLFYNIYS
jgi:hypothetical protein